MPRTKRTANPSSRAEEGDRKRRRGARTISKGASDSRIAGKKRMTKSEVSMNHEEALTRGAAGRHETFTPRYGWLKKGFDHCAVNPHVFNEDDAIEKLGVGKNMVRSIRFWCVLLKLLEDGGKHGCLVPSSFGRELLDDGFGRDPYLEDPASLWLLHWQLFKPPFIAVSWNLAFSYTTLQTFTMRELADAICSKASEIDGLSRIAKGSFEKDASCILRMYASQTRERADIRCPFVDLGLIVHASEHAEADRCRFSPASKTSLPDLVFGAAVFDYAATWFGSQNTLPLAEIAFGPSSPGLAFRLSESDCGHRLDNVCRQLKKAAFADSNGIRQIQFNASAVELRDSCLHLYYGSAR